MEFSTHSVSNAHPVDTAWVDDALAAIGEPLGVLVGWPLGGGAGIMIVAWPDGAGDGQAGSGRFRLVEARAGRATGPARYLQTVAFDGPRSAEWVAADERAATGRLWPATREVAGIVGILRLRAEDNASMAVILAESADAIDEGIRAVMSTPLLPDEDPALLTGADRIGIYRLVHADLPVDTVLEGSHP